MPVPPRSCSRCHEQKRRCNLTTQSPCTRCIETGHNNLCIAYAVTRKKGCSQCRTRRIKCIVVGSSCEKCISVGVWDCMNKDTSTSGSSSPETMLHHPSNDSSPSLNKIVDTFESPLMDMLSQESVMEDPDLMPMPQDYALCFRLFTANGSKAPTTSILDAGRFLSNFYTVSPALRLVFCAYAAVCSPTPIPEDAQLSYYKRARKALVRLGHQEPCLEMIQTYYLLYTFSSLKGQPMIGKHFLKAALDMIAFLQMDIDPDDSPWLSHLTPREKEERRRAFWHTHNSLTFENAVSPNAIPIEIKLDKVKGCGEDPLSSHYYPPPMSTLLWEYIFDIIAMIKEAYVIPPKSLNELIQFPAYEQLNQTLLSYAIEQLSGVLLHADSPVQLTETDIFRFQEILTVQKKELNQLPSISLYFFSAVSILNRPKLFATIASPRPELSHEARTCVLSSIQQCLDSAFRMANIFWFAKQSGIFPADATFMAFEAATVLYFVSCRMHQAWKEYSAVRIGAVLFEQSRSRMALETLLDFGRLVSEKEGGKSGTAAPLVYCMEAMLKEVMSSGNGTQLDILEEVEVVMKVMSLVDSEDAHENVVLEPYGFLGLLGLSVGGGIRWRGRSENSWRLFWKLYL